MTPETIEYIKQWLYKANEDLTVVDRLTTPEIIANASACFHCQQAVEKSLKAFLICHSVEIKKTHNIEFLLSECSDIDPDFADIDPKELSEFGVDVRYPGDMYMPSVEEVLEYKSLAIGIKQLVEMKIEKELSDRS